MFYICLLFTSQLQHTKTLISFSCAIALLLCASCSSGGSQGTVKVADTAAVPGPQYDRSLAAGQVLDSINCTGHAGHMYALYLPSYYTPSKPFPCIYLFDSHGIGILPVSSYKDIAERYGYILVGSDVSRNGIQWEAHHDAAVIMMTDTRSRLNIDPKRIYTVGFSGGSRVAVTLAISDGGISGVIGCAAGFPKYKCDPQPSFSYFGIVGNQDFNYNEMQQWDELLAQKKFIHQLLTSDGIHGWPAAADFETAVLWLQADAMKKQLQPKNDTVITALRKDYDRRIAASTSAHDWLQAYSLVNGAIQVLSGMTDITTIEQQSGNIAASDNFKNAVNKQIKLAEEEGRQQDDAARQYGTLDEKGLAGKIQELNKKAHTAKDPQERHMYERLLQYFGFVSYTYAGQAMAAGDLLKADIYIKTFIKADPKNPDGGYLAATYCMKKGDAANAISSLNAAVQLGYNDVAQLSADPAFAGLHNDARFQAVIQKAARNRLK